MNKREYIFNEASWILMFVYFFATLILNSYIINNTRITNYFPKGIMSGLVGITFVILIPILVSRIMAFSKTIITLSNDEISVRRSSLIGIPIKANFKLHYSQIKEFVFQEDMNWYWLKLVDVNNRKYRIWKFAWFNNNQFKLFRDRLNNEIKWYNQSLENSQNRDLKSDAMVEIATNIYQGKSGIVLGIFSAVFLVVLPILIIITKQDITKTIAPLLIGLSGAGFTFFKVINEQKKK